MPPRAAEAPRPRPVSPVRPRPRAPFRPPRRPAVPKTPPARPAAREPTAEEMLDAALHREQSVAARAPERPPDPELQDEERVFNLVLRSSRTELIQQLESALQDADATASFEEGLTALQAYMLFVLHYRDNHLTVNGIHQWPVIPHSALRFMKGRIAFTRQVSRPWDEIQRAEIVEVIRFLISRFAQEPSVPIGEQEIGRLAKSILASRIPYREMFQVGATHYADSAEATHIWEFPVQYFPGPAISPNQWYLWGHGTTPSGLVGVLTAGRVFRSDANVVGTPPDDDCYSFYGKACQYTNWTPALTEFLVKLHHSTKNASGIVVGGFMGCQHVKGKRAETSHESRLCKYHCLVHSASGDKRWAIREAGARIDRIWVMSDTHQVSQGQSSSSRPFLLPSASLALTNQDEDWGANWPSPST